MRYTHTFTVLATLSQVASFHAKSESMGAITPPPVVVRIHHAPEVLREGDEMDFTLWLLFIPIRWRARILDVSSNGFLDKQVQGPFASWQHKHIFTSLNELETEVRDEVEATLSTHPLKWLVGAGMWLSMPMLFAFRAWKTRKLLQR